MRQIELKHDGLGRFRLIRGRDEREVQHKARLQRAIWDEIWERRRRREEQRRAEEARAIGPEMQDALASERTAEALQALFELENTLRSILGKSHALDWEALKDRTPFAVREPKPPDKATYPEKPSKAHMPPKPTQVEPEYSALEKLLPFQKEKKRRDAEAAFKMELMAWKDMIREFNERVERYNEHVLQIKKLNQEVAASYQIKLSEWEEARRRFEAEQQARNAEIDAEKRAYLDASPPAVLAYCERVLLNSSYPDAFPQTFDLAFDAEGKTLRVDYRLPAIGQVSRVQLVEYDPAVGWVETELAEIELRDLYEGLIPRIVLRTLHELFAADVAGALRAIDFHGTAAGGAADVVSVHVSKERFQALDLGGVDPKACLEALGG